MLLVCYSCIYKVYFCDFRFLLQSCASNALKEIQHLDWSQGGTLLEVMYTYLCIDITHTYVNTHILRSLHQYTVAEVMDKFATQISVSATF